MTSSPSLPGYHPDDFSREREMMVRHQLAARGIQDARLLEAMVKVPRHLFVPPEYMDQAYADSPLPIGGGQTISQPFMVAWMTELLTLTGREKVLEVGTGSGYQAAILSLLADKVTSIERSRELAAEARKRLGRLGYGSVEVIEGDGSKGYPEEAPYDGIIVTAGAPEIPRPLTEQLADSGRLIIPVGGSGSQVLILAKRQGDKVVTRELGSCAFVPLVGRYGWAGRGDGQSRRNRR